MGRYGDITGSEGSKPTRRPYRQEEQDFAEFDLERREKARRQDRLRASVGDKIEERIESRRKDGKR